MVAKDFEVNDLVWARMKGFPFWPGKIVSPPADAKINPKKAQHYVYFFGTENYAWILDENIKHHTEELLTATPKKKSSSLQSAIDRIVKENSKLSSKSKANKGEKSDAFDVMLKESSTPVKDKTPAEIPEAVDKPKSPKKSLLKKSKSSSIKTKSPKTADISITDETKSSPEKVLPPVKSPKKTPQKRKSADEKEPEHQQTPVKSPPPKIRKVDEASSSVTRNIAMIRPYTDNDAAPTSTRRRAVPEYIERPSTPTLDLTNISDFLRGKNVQPTDKKIGFLGLGLMGRAMVKNLMNSGHNVMVWNRTEEKCIDFVAAGAKQGTKPSDVVSACDITFSCVSDPEAVKAIVFSNDGVLKGFDGCESGSKAYVEMSSIDSQTSREIEEAITFKQGRYLEAPISGSSKMADEGSLVILCSGDRSLFNDCESCFYAMSKNAYYLSCDVGCGTNMNLIFSMLQGTTYVALAEAMAMVERNNLSLANFLEILELSPANCDMLKEKGECMMKKEFCTSTALKHQQKDLNLALLLGDSVEQPMLLTAAANEVYKRAKALKYAEHDVSAVVLGALF